MCAQSQTDIMTKVTELTFVACVFMLIVFCLHILLVFMHWKFLFLHCGPVHGSSAFLCMYYWAGSKQLITFLCYRAHLLVIEALMTFFVFADWLMTVVDQHACFVFFCVCTLHVYLLAFHNALKVSTVIINISLFLV